MATRQKYTVMEEMQMWRFLYNMLRKKDRRARDSMGNLLWQHYLDSQRTSKSLASLVTQHMHGNVEHAQGLAKNELLFVMRELDFVERRFPDGDVTGKSSGRGKTSSTARDTTALFDIDDSTDGSDEGGGDNLQVQADNPSLIPRSPSTVGKSPATRSASYRRVVIDGEEGERERVNREAHANFGIKPCRVVVPRIAMSTVKAERLSSSRTHDECLPEGDLDPVDDADVDLDLNISTSRHEEDGSLEMAASGKRQATLARQMNYVHRDMHSMLETVFRGREPPACTSRQRDMTTTAKRGSDETDQVTVSRPMRKRAAVSASSTSALPISKYPLIVGRRHLKTGNVGQLQSKDVGETEILQQGDAIREQADASQDIFAETASAQAESDVRHDSQIPPQPQHEGDIACLREREPTTCDVLWPAFELFVKANTALGTAMQPSEHDYEMRLARSRALWEFSRDHKCSFLGLLKMAADKDRFETVEQVIAYVKENAKTSRSE